MEKEFELREIALLERRFLEIILKKKDLIEIKMNIKHLKKMVKNSNSKILDKKKSTTRLSSLQRACDRKLKQFSYATIYFSFDLIYSLQFHSSIKNKKLLTACSHMIKIGPENEDIDIDTLSKKVFNPSVNSLESALIHDVISRSIYLLEGKKKSYANDTLSITDNESSYTLEITLKGFFSFGKINGRFRNEIKKIFFENKLSSICYIKKVSSLSRNGSENYFFVKENYISIDKIGLYIGQNLNTFDIKAIDLFYKSSNDLFLRININKYLFNHKINREILLPSMFVQKLVNKNNVSFLNKILYESVKNLPACSDMYIYSEKDIYVTPSKLSNIKNILIFLSYKLFKISVEKNRYLHISGEELSNMGLLKHDKYIDKYLFNTYLYIKLFIELYDWPLPSSSVEIIYTYKSKMSNILIKRLNMS
jgi:hypothetical protein